MNALNALIERQYQLERAYRGFLSSLDGLRTTTLRSLIENPGAALDKLNAEWFDHNRMLRRLGATATFFESIVAHQRIPGYSGIPLIFLQATDPAEDHKEFRQRVHEYHHLRKRYGNLPPEAFYLHIETNFFPELRGTWRSKQRIITPLHPFTSKGQVGTDHKGRTWRDKDMIVGYRVPSYPQILKVSEQTGTDYLTRMIVHDLGHGFLPDVNFDYESLHNVTMIYAMQTEVNDEPVSPWERLIHAECSNPFFFLEASSHVDGIAGMALSPLQQSIAKKYTSWYVSEKLRSKKTGSNRYKHLEKLWGITPEMEPTAQRQKVVETIDEMTKNGFAGYQ